MSQAQSTVGLNPLGADQDTQDSAPRLRGVLRNAARRRRGANSIGRVLLAIASWIALFLLCIALDAALSLPDAARWAAWGLLMGSGLAFVFVVLRNLIRPLEDVRQTAVAVEHSSSMEPSRLINALDLATVRADADSTSPALRRLAVARGEQSAPQLNPRVLVDRGALGRATLAAAVAIVLVGVGVLSMPGVFSAVVPRLVSPWADLPPYTALRFDVAVGPEVIHIGKPGVVEVTLTHPNPKAELPAEANIVFVESDGQKHAAPMHRSFFQADPQPQTAGSPQTPPTRFAYRFERLDAAITFYIDTPDGQSRRYTVTPETAPLFESLHATITPPDYTGHPTVTQRLDPHTPDIDPEAGSTPSNVLPQNTVRAWRGSVMTLTAQSNVELATVTVTDIKANHTPREFAADQDAPHTAAATLIVGDSNTCTIHLVGRDGKTSQHTVTLALTTLEDLAPSVDIVNPEPLAFAVEGWPIPVQVVAKDDVGLQSLTLHPRLNQTPLDAIQLLPARQADTPGNPPTANALHTFDPLTLETKPGDTLQFFATAHDNLPTAYGGPPNDVGQRAETPVFQVQIISQQEWDEIARTQYGIEQLQAELEAISEGLGELAEARQSILEQLEMLEAKAASGQSLNDLERQQLQELQEQLESFAQDAQQLAEALEQRAAQPSVYEFEEPFKEQLQELAEQLKNQADQAEATQDAAQKLSLPSVTPTQLDEFAQQAEAFEQQAPPFDQTEQERLEQLEEDLIKIELADELVYHAERIREVIVQQRELETKLAELQWIAPEDLTDEQTQRLASYAEQELEMREELEDAALMLRETAELAGPLLPLMSSSAIALTESLDQLYVYPDMESVAEYAEGLETSLAHASAQVAADKLESLLSEAGNVAAQADGDLDGVLSLPKAALGDAMQQMQNARAMKMGMGQQPGNQGGASAGQRANASLIGPRQFSSGDSNSQSGAQANNPNHRGGFSALINPQPGEAESLDPDSATSLGHPAIAVPGVPPRYQDVAAAYFQRLAEEAAREAD